MSDYSGSYPSCTCDTSNGSEARMCSFCKDRRAIWNEPKRKTKRNRKVKKTKEKKVHLMNLRTLIALMRHKN